MFSFPVHGDVRDFRLPTVLGSDWETKVSEGN